MRATPSSAVPSEHQPQLKVMCEVERLLSRGTVRKRAVDNGSLKKLCSHTVQVSNTESSGRRLQVLRMGCGAAAAALCEGHQRLGHVVTGRMAGASTGRATQPSWRCKGVHGTWIAVV